MIAENRQELEYCLHERSAGSKQRSLEINMKKTKVKSYIYPGQRMSLTETTIESKVNRRTQGRMKKSLEYKVLLKSGIPLGLKHSYTIKVSCQQGNMRQRCGHEPKPHTGNGFWQLLKEQWKRQ